MTREAALLEGILNEKKEVLQKQVLQRREQKGMTQRNAALAEELTVHSRQLAQDLEAQNINKQTGKCNRVCGKCIALIHHCEVFINEHFERKLEEE